MSVTVQPVTLTDTFIALFDANREVLAQTSAPWVDGMRGSAMECFQRLGIPDNKVENYKYTNLQPFFRGKFGYQFSSADLSNLVDSFRCEVPQLETHQVFMVNGWHVQTKVVGNLPNGVVIGSFMEFALKYPHLVEKYYGQAAPIESDGPTALNTAFAQDGFVIYVPKGVTVEQPIQMVNILWGESDMMTTQRNLIVVEENSEVRVMLCDHTMSSHKFVMNSVTEVFVGEYSRFDAYHQQNQHNMTTQVAGFFIRQKAHSVVSSNHLTLHSGIARNNIYVTMDDEHCESHLYGLYLNDKNQHVDNFSFIDHAKPNCTSNELFKGVLDDYASGAFTGKIMVRADAQHTNAYQSNNNLLLTSDAKINTRPQLEIYADDVKCSHGATVGQLDQNAMFYLRSRGVSPEEARVLLMYAFTYEVIEKIGVEPLREQIRDLVEKRFRGELDKCESCVMCGAEGHKVSCL